MRLKIYAVSWLNEWVEHEFSAKLFGYRLWEMPETVHAENEDSQTSG